MKKDFQFKKIVFQFLPVLLGTMLLLMGCSKEAGDAELNLSYKMLADKTWFLQYTETTNVTATTTKSYLGQTTYFINFLANKSTTDSDGLKGTYAVQKINKQLKIQVTITTTGGSQSNYAYDVVSLGDKNMVLSFTNGTTITKYYYSTDK